MSERATPLYCPYCGDEDLRPQPAEELSSAAKPSGDLWLCTACRRVFAVSFAGLLFGEVSR